MLTKVKELFNDSAKDLKKLSKLAAQVNSLEDKYASFSDDELRAMTDIFNELTRDVDDMIDGW